MTNDSTDWHQALARVIGQLVRGEQRVTTHELLTVHLGVPVTDRACRRLRRVMRELGWRGPRLMRWGKKDAQGVLAASNGRLAGDRAGATGGGSSNGGAGDAGA